MQGFTERELTIDFTVVAIAFVAVAGIVAVSYSPASQQIQTMAIGIFGAIGGGATGVAVPRGKGPQQVTEPRKRAPRAELPPLPRSSEEAPEWWYR